MPAISFPTSPTVGQQVTIGSNIYTWDGTAWKVSTNSIALSINNLTDVDTSTTPPTNGQLLKYDGTNWIPGTASGTAYNGYRNKLVNGSMKICQRSDTSTSISFPSVAATTKYYLADRWYYKQNRTDVFLSCSANSYGNYFRDYTGVVTGHCSMISPNTTTIYSDMVYGLFQDIEARDTEEFNLGVVGYAKPMVLSFWVNVSATGTYPVSVNIGTTHSFVSSYTITSATAGSNTVWQYVQIPIPAFTLATVPINGTNYPMKICFGGIIGSTYSTSTTNQWVAGEYYAPTGSNNLIGFKTLLVGAVQLEVGTTATPFEVLDMGLQLRRCQRYYWTVNTAASGSPGWVGEMGVVTASTTNALLRVTHPEPMRVAPTVTTVGTLTAKDGNGWSSTATYNAGGSDHRANVSELYFNLATAGTLFRPIFIMTNSNSGRINFSADD